MRKSASPKDLSRCGACGRLFVEPEFGLEDGKHWRVFLRCHSCGWAGERLLDEGTLERLDRELDAEREQIAVDLERVTHANMCEYAARFVAALNAGALLPEDF